ncbi:DNA repair protein RecO [Aestuariibacter halophilus]|uniref:DNA repair protein RecO n=1 Tax=Fluctibacter halophilus TaxID=226011 RepID=A0ABS8GB76_9ALTE|nr:DNA repair protein RecO [Aestuariibacter halophilus]MCC2617787.1 DNA repair protein RecO [Aestuariibacter halophilus]
MSVQDSAIDAWVLHRRPYRETSLLVDLFSRQWGKMTLVCKGVRGSKSDKKSLLQPFQPLSVNLYGRHELKNLRSVESLGPRLALREQALFCGMYMNELLNRVLLPQVAQDALYAQYEHSLLSLAQSAPLQPLLREFEWVLLEDLGYGFDWQHDAETGTEIDPGQTYTYMAQQGFVVAGTGAHARWQGQLLLDVAERRWGPDSLRCAKQVMRLALHPLIGDKPLKSRELFIQLERR